MNQPPKSAHDTQPAPAKPTPSEPGTQDPPRIPRVSRASLLDELPKKASTAPAKSRAPKTQTTTAAKDQATAAKPRQDKTTPAEPEPYLPAKPASRPPKTSAQEKTDLAQASLFEPPAVVPAKPSANPPTGAKPRPAKTPPPEPPIVTEAQPGSFETIKKRVRNRSSTTK